MRNKIVKIAVIVAVLLEKNPQNTAFTAFKVVLRTIMLYG